MQDPTIARPARFASVDVLRGWAVAAMLLVNYPGDWGQVFAPLLHAPWDGFTPTDLIFPAFLFVVGVSIALGLRADGALPTVWARALRLVLLGLALHLVAMWAYDTPAFRPWGVLQRIGLCYGVAATLALRLRARGQWTVIVLLLVGYGLLLALTGGTEPWTNLPSRVDAWMLGAHAYQFDAASGRGHEPEGLLSTLPAIATTLLGVRAGLWLRESGARVLVPAALVALAMGAALNLLQPWNKNLWTPAYVLWSAGWSMLLLALCHRWFDLRRWPPFGRALGGNAIVAYAGSWVLACVLEKFGLFAALYRGAMQPAIAPWLGAKTASLAFALAFVVFWWLAMGAMARRGWRVSL